MHLVHSVRILLVKSNSRVRSWKRGGYWEDTGLSHVTKHKQIMFLFDFRGIGIQCSQDPPFHLSSLLIYMSAPFSNVFFHIQGHRDDQSPVSHSSELCPKSQMILFPEVQLRKFLEGLK